MGLEIYSEDKQKMLDITDEDTLYLENNVLETFNNKYNNLFDLYSDFRLYKNHQEHLLLLLNSLKIKPKIILQFEELLNVCVRNNTVLIVIGN